jgi:3-isopropylmalate/(R)-2-methylmalate dehydratase large subunit
MDDPISFRGRVLFLSNDAEAMRRQLAGQDLALADCRPLRDNVSTDEITPVTVMLVYDHRLGRYAYVGYQAGGVLPIATDAVRNGGFAVTVAGGRYGKGSSRESSPLAEKSAGIRLIVAQSFERIYRQNCDNIGLLTTTDFSILERILAGEAIPLEQILAGRDELTQRILRAGGLLPFCKAHLPRVEGRHVAPWPAAERPLTLAEKIILRRKVLPEGEVNPGDGLWLSADWRFSHDYFTGMCAHFMQEAFGDAVPLERPAEIIAFQDHLTLVEQSVPHVQGGLVAGVHGLFEGHHRFVAKYPVRAHGQLPGEAGSEGICHAMMAETYALPGQVVIGTDSHTPHSGALGCLAFGAGSTDIANSWVTGMVRCRMPETIRFELVGRLQPGVAARDVVQYLLQTEFVRSGQAIGAVFEYGGPVIRAMSVDERATITNLTAEMGGFAGIVEPDDKTVQFLHDRRGIDFTIEAWMHSDPGARYKQVIRIDCDRLSPMVARPGDPGNALPLAELDEHVRIDIALGGSCTGGKREDFDIYHAVVKWGLDRGMTVSKGTRLVLQFGTVGVRDYCREKGYIATFEAAGATLVPPGCGACANCGPGQSVREDEVTVSSINRNFPGRSGPGKVWLGSPFTVAASALAGHLTSFPALVELHP